MELPRFEPLRLSQSFGTGSHTLDKSKINDETNSNEQSIVLNESMNEKRSTTFKKKKKGGNNLEEKQLDQSVAPQRNQSLIKDNVNESIEPITSDEEESKTPLSNLAHSSNRLVERHSSSSNN